MDTFPKFYTPGAIFLLTVAFGFWVSYAGKPYNGLLFNIHKLIALGGVILTAMQVYKLLKTSPPQILLTILIIVAALCVIALFASGAFLSIGNLNYRAMKLIHNTAPVLAVLVMGFVIYLLSGRSL
jgi:hypothetical protein